MAPAKPRPPARFEDSASSREAIARLGRRLEGVEPAIAFRPAVPKRRKPSR